MLSRLHITLLCGLAFTVSCKESAPAGSKDSGQAEDAVEASSKSSNKNSKKDQSPSSDGDCKNSAKKTAANSDDDKDDDKIDDKGPNSKDDDDSAFSAALVESPTYADVANLMKGKCLSCHGAGQTKPDLSTYAAVKAQGSQVVEAVKSGSMPPNKAQAFSKTEQDQLAAWLAAGMPEKLSSGTTTASSTNTSNSSASSSSSDCDDSEDDASASSDSKQNVATDDAETGATDPGLTAEQEREAAWKALLNPPKLEECKSKSNLYDRGKDKCHVSSIAKTYECTVPGVIKKFASLGISLAASGDTLTGFDGFEIDQCGEYQGEPAVFFVQKVGDKPDELKLNIKLLCKKGSAACQR